MIAFIISLILSGLIIGALARLAIPGPNPMSVVMTILVGVAGSLLGGLVSRALGATGGLAFVIAVLAAALIVWIVGRNTSPTRRRPI